MYLSTPSPAPKPGNGNLYVGSICWMLCIQWRLIPFCFGHWALHLALPWNTWFIILFLDHDLLCFSKISTPPSLSGIFNSLSSHQLPPILTPISNQFWFHNPPVKVFCCWFSEFLWKLIFGLLSLPFPLPKRLLTLLLFLSDIFSVWRTCILPPIYVLDVASLGKPSLNLLGCKSLLTLSHTVSRWASSPLDHYLVTICSSSHFLEGCLKAMPTEGTAES